jgi:hypothetical protein
MPVQSRKLVGHRRAHAVGQRLGACVEAVHHGALAAVRCGALGDGIVRESGAERRSIAEPWMDGSTPSAIAAWMERAADGPPSRAHGSGAAQAAPHRIAHS